MDRRADSEGLDVHMNTVHTVRQRLVEEGFEGFELALHRKKQEHPSQAPIFDEAKERTLIAIVQSERREDDHDGPRSYVAIGWCSWRSSSE